MKRKYLLWVGFSLGIILCFWSSLAFQHTQKSQFQQLKLEQNLLKADIKTLENDLSFLKHHQNEIHFLISKGWLTPKSRLIASDIIEQLQDNVNEIQMTFEPETQKSLGTNHTFKVTKIILDVGARLESDIYVFVDKLLDKFPVILTLHELTIAREEEITRENLFAYQENESPNFLIGQIVFDWFSMGTKDHNE